MFSREETPHSFSIVLQPSSRCRAPSLPASRSLHASPTVSCACRLTACTGVKELGLLPARRVPRATAA